MAKRGRQKGTTAPKRTTSQLIADLEKKMDDKDVQEAKTLASESENVVKLAGYYLRQQKGMGERYKTMAGLLDDDEGATLLALLAKAKEKMKKTT